MRIFRNGRANSCDNRTSGTAHRVNRSAADGCSSTSGTASSPSPIAQSASLPAAYSRFFARSRPSGPVLVITSRANAAAGGGTDDGRHRPI